MPVVIVIVSAYAEVAVSESQTLLMPFRLKQVDARVSQAHWVLHPAHAMISAIN